MNCEMTNGQGKSAMNATPSNAAKTSDNKKSLENAVQKLKEIGSHGVVR